jgi:hypothetical protein
MVEYMSDQPSVHDMQLLFAKKRLYELQEAVRWEREGDEQYQNFGYFSPDLWFELTETLVEARAAVDALVEEK